MRRFLLVLIVLLWTSQVVFAAVELSRDGKAPQLLPEVYHHQGMPYLAIDDVLPALGLRGYWNSVAHQYVISTPSGKATFFSRGTIFAIGRTLFTYRPSSAFY